MKRKFVMFIVSVLAIVCAAACLSACNKSTDEPPKSNICRRTDSYLAGESESFAVSVERGIREKTFIADGIATDVNEFCEINITPLVKNDYESIAFVLSDGEGNMLSGSTDSGKFGEFRTNISLEFVPTVVTVTAGDESSEIEFANILEGCISSTDAINIARSAFKDKLEKEAADGLPEREIYVKVITGDRLNYYYYVSFIGDGVDYWALLVDIKTGEVVSRK